MTANDIADYVRAHISTFQGVRHLGEGVAYHYTIRSDEILRFGRFLGAPLSQDLDCTQNPDQANTTTADPGVVFAYESLTEAAEEGDCLIYPYPGSEPKVFKIVYRRAVEATHIQEAELGTPPTILISSMDIVSFECLGPCSELYDDGA